MKLGMIYARARNGVIGKDGGLPWHLPADLAHFKRVTLGCPVIMGRRTWESIPERFRPLPGRLNVVVTRQQGWRSPGATHASSLAEAIAVCHDQPRAWVIGGAGLFTEALPLADTIEVTEIDADFDGDVHAPALGAGWHEAARQPQQFDAGVPFAFVTYTRVEPATH
jgi:dihydrofolate reductase